MTPQHPFTLQVEKLDPTFVVRAFRGSEELSKPFRFRVDVDLPVDDTDWDDWSDVLGRQVLLKASVGGKMRLISGRLERLQQGNRVELSRNRVTIHFGPRLARLKLRRNSRVFQNLSAVDIAGRLLAEHDVPYQRQLARDYVVREICLQHQETDFAFVTRLLAEEGVAYRFEGPPDDAPPGKAGGDTLVLFDSHDRYVDVPDGGSALVAYDDASGDAMLRPENGVWNVSGATASRPNAVLLRQYDFKHPELMPAAGQTESKLSTSTVYEHHGPFGEMQVTPLSPAMVLEQTRRGASVASGQSACARLSAGQLVDLSGHHVPGLAGKYGVVRVRHRGQVQTTADALLYENSFGLVPGASLQRPKRPKPKVMQSLETATVVGPADEEIYVDDVGRIKVQFHWDLEGKYDTGSSCWIRAAQSWSGPNFGAQFIPRIGMEVLVAFLGGDPDRPMVVGCVPNATHRPPFPLPGDKERSGWRTRSSPNNDNAGFNELSFQDGAGKECINLRAHKDLTLEVTDVMRTSVSGSSVLEVASSHSLDVGGRLDTRVAGPSTTSLGAGGSVLVEGGLAEDIRGSHRVRVRDTVEEEVGGSTLMNVEGGSERNVQGPWVDRAGSRYLLVVGDHDGLGHAETQVRGTSIHAADGAVLISSAETITLASGESRIEISPSGIRIEAPKIELKAKEVTATTDGPSLKLTDRAEMRAKEVVIRSEEASLELDKDATIKGRKVYLNCGPPPPPPEDESGEPATKEFSVKLTDQYFEPYAGKHYELRAAELKVEGETGPDGSIAQDVPKHARIANIEVWTDTYPDGPTRSYAVKIDLLPPIETLPGLRHRLANLGYYQGRIEGDELDGDTIAALSEFQADHELDVTGEPDEKTLTAIKARNE